MQSRLHGLPGWLHPLVARAPIEDDADFLARLYASTRPDLDSATADPAFVASLIGMQQRFQAAGYRQAFPDAANLLLELDGAPCGRIVVDAGAGALRLVDLALLPERRGQGLGRHIVMALQRCAAHSSLPMTLAVHHANVRARRLYVALGFRPHSQDTLSEQMLWNNE